MVTINSTEVYFWPYQKSIMEFSCKYSKRFKVLNYFPKKSSIIDVWGYSKYDSAKEPDTYLTHKSTSTLWRQWIKVSFEKQNLSLFLNLVILNLRGTCYLHFRSFHKNKLNSWENVSSRHCNICKNMKITITT